MINFSTPLEGLHRAESSLQRTAQRVATLGTPQGDSVDLSTEIVAMLSAKTAAQANLNLLRTEADISASVLNLLG
jgi:flagellar basal body rod protein FlgC